MARAPATGGGFDDLEEDTDAPDRETWASSTVGQLAPGSAVGRRYVLARLLSESRASQVWRCKDLTTGVDVALKLLPKVGGPGWERIWRESTLVQSLSGPDFVTPFDAGETDTLVYLAMELLDGEDLARLLDRTGRLRPAEAADLIRALAGAVDRAHAAGVVHRDLKPKNVFLQGGEGHARPRILDFGIAKRPGLASRITKSGILLGTPHYMSPEQIMSGHRVDHRADLWSLAAMTYRCLVGRRPFEGELVELLRRIVGEPHPSASALVPELPTEVDAVFARALAKDPDARFQRAAALSAALDGALGVTAASACPP